MTPTTEPDLLTIRAWWEPELATSGHDPLGPYAETYWLPVLGPAATLSHRVLVRGLRDHPQGYQIRLDDFARGLGLGTAKGRNGPAPWALDRLCYFGLARQRDTLDVRMHVPALAHHLERRLPRSLKERHAAFIAATRTDDYPTRPSPPNPPRPRPIRSVSGSSP